MNKMLERTLKPKKHSIFDDYKLTTSVLGHGINGNVLECVSIKTNRKFALKVRINTNSFPEDANKKSNFRIDLHT